MSFPELERDMRPEVAALFTTLATDYFADTGAARGAVSTGLGPDALFARFEEPLPRAGQPVEDVVARLRRDVVADANRLSHPMYMGHQVSAPLPAAVWAECVVAALNNSVAVWEMSPTGTAVERQVIRWMAELAGWPADAGGTLTSGGTEATFTALLAARSRAIPDVWTDGVGANPPVVVYGEHAHYAVARAVGEMGLGLRNAIAVPSRDWRIDVDALGRTLAELEASGRRVMAVVATAGSTATGSFDDLARVADLCDARDLWLHVDGAHGGSALLSARHRGRLAGIERARSMAWDPHKMMLLPLTAGMVLVRDERALEAAFAQKAPYLFHKTGEARSPDQGQRSFLCSRRADAIKLWVALQRYGADGIAAVHDHLCEVAAAMHARIGARDDFETLHAPESNILCFRYLGSGALDSTRMDALNRQLRERYNASGAGWITATILGGRRVLRVTIMNPRTTVSHVERLLDGLADVGRALETELPS
jgi:L-2,4-diaminobutyrate decarboxylase